MLSKEQVKRIRELRDDGLLFREIAKKVGCHATTASNVINGKLAKREEPKRRERKTFRCEPYRCPGCGAMVVISPCLSCDIERIGSYGRPGMDAI